MISAEMWSSLLSKRNQNVDQDAVNDYEEYGTMIEVLRENQTFEKFEIEGS